MTLVLQGIKLNDESLSQPLIGRFDERGGTLGRSDNATFTLPDPERLISRVQAQILFGDEGYWVEHVSTANSTFHNGRPLGAGMRVLLSEGDELRIGGYTLIAAFESDETSATVLRGRTVIMSPPGPPTRPRAALDSAAAPTEATRNFPPTNGSDQLQGLLQGEMGVLLTGSMRSALETVLERFTATATEREEAQAEFRRLLDQALRQAYDAQLSRK
jgi:FHA domain-containing protein